MKTAKSLDDAVIVVTGASSGVGRATALAFADLGARIVVAARGEAALAEVVAECERRRAQAISVATDVGDAVAVERLADAAVARFGRIDVWVEAASVVIAGDLTATNPEELRRLIDTNVGGAVFGARAALRVFESQGSGTLVNISSMLGLLPNPVVPAYVMSKFAIRGLSLSLRQAVAANPEIHVCAVLPGPIDTPLFQRAANHTGKELRSIPPALAPERVAAAIVACARRPRRQIVVGLNPRLIALSHRISPRVTEWAVARVTMRLITRPADAPATSGALFVPPASGAVHGGWRLIGVRRILGERFGRWMATRGARG